jgi:hypothetical protein
MPSGEIDGFDGLVSADDAQLETALLLLAIDSLDVASSAAELIVVLELTALDELSLGDQATFGQIVELLAREQIMVNSSAFAAQRQALQYAVNAASGALTTYQGFDFQGYTTGRDATYAWKADGLYRIGAGTDNGELVSALLDFGTTDYGNSQIKRSDMAYIGVRTDGQCFLRVQADAGPDRIYRVQGESNVRRAQLAKGVAGRYWSVKLELTDVSFAEVDAIELAIGTTQRRGFGARS